MRFVGDGRYEVADVVPPSRPKANEAVVAVASSGICGTDLKVLSDSGADLARPGVVLGHEFAGTVVEAGNEVKHVRPGDRVAVNPNLGCGVCRACGRGRPMACMDPINLGARQNGGLAELVAVPGRALHRIADQVNWSEASLIEPLACVLEALKPVQISPGSQAAVVGAGPMGLLAVCVLAIHGTRPLFVFEPSEVRASIAARCGATDVADGSRISLNVWKELTGDQEGPDIVVDAVGTMLPSCMELVAGRGTVVQMGYNPAAELMIRPGLLSEKAMRIVGSDGSEFTFTDAMRLVQQGDAPFSEIVTAQLPIEKFGEALERLRKGQEAKVLVTFQDRDV